MQVNSELEESAKRTHAELRTKVRELGEDKGREVGEMFMDLGHDRQWFDTIGGYYPNPSELDWLKTYVQAYSLVSGQHATVVVEGQNVTLQYKSES